VFPHSPFFNDPENQRPTHLRNTKKWPEQVRYRCAPTLFSFLTPHSLFHNCTVICNIPMFMEHRLSAFIENSSVAQRGPVPILGTFALKNRVAGNYQNRIGPGESS
jgi:hypothetical protein